MITVFTKPVCPQCEQTKRYLKSAKVEYNVRPVEEVTGLIEDLEIMTAPIVVMELDTGFFAIHSGHKTKILDKMILVTKQKEAEAKRAEADVYDF